MDVLDRLLAHDTWTTRQLLLACQALPDADLDRRFEIDHGSLRHTFAHILGAMEGWTDLMLPRPVADQPGASIPEMLTRLEVIGRDFAHSVRNVVPGRYSCRLNDG
jgi:uncharacterized damage-inducible protein DinB